MLKRLSFILLLVSIAQFAFAQVDPTEQKIQIMVDSLKTSAGKLTPKKITVDTLKKISADVFKKIISEQFSNLLIGKVNNGIGNYADLDMTEGKLSFQASSISKKGSVFSIKATGGVDEGLFSVFNHSKFNSNLGLEVQYNFLALSEQNITYADRSQRDYLKTKKAANLSYKSAYLQLEHIQQVTLWRSERAKLAKQKMKLDSTLKVTKLALAQDSLNYEIKNLAFRIDTLRDNILNYPDPIIGEIDLAYDHSKKIKDLHQKLDIRGFSFGWFSMGYTVNASDFKRFDSAIAYSDQVQADHFVSHQAKFQWSHYRYSDMAFKSRYWNIGLALSYSDNLSSLKKIELAEEKQYGSAPEERKSVKKYNVYTGAYEKDLLGLKFYADFYQFLLADNRMGIHLYPEYQTKTHSKPILNTGVGVFFSFKNNTTDKAVVNAELYYNFLDVFKTTDVDYRLFERNDVGIRFVFPIAFKSYK